jgi:hypothetical protein
MTDVVFIKMMSDTNKRDRNECKGDCKVIESRELHAVQLCMASKSPNIVGSLKVSALKHLTT